MEKAELEALRATIKPCPFCSGRGMINISTYYENEDDQDYNRNGLPINVICCVKCGVQNPPVKFILSEEELEIKDRIRKGMDSFEDHIRIGKFCDERLIQTIEAWIVEKLREINVLRNR